VPYTFDGEDDIIRRSTLERARTVARTTVNLDEQVLTRLRDYVPERGLSRFINETLSEKVALLERERLEAAMKEGYLATRKDRSQLNADWEVVDGEGWPE
jgi:hypothetical protein